MPSLWVLADDPEEGISSVTFYLQFLVYFSVAAAVQHRLLSYCPHEAFLVLHVDGRPVLETQTAVVLPDTFVWRMLVVVEARDAPGSMGGREDESLKEGDFLEESEVDVALLTVLFIGRDEFVLVGEVAGHEWESNW